MPKRLPNPISPELAKMWHPTKNGKALPEHYTGGSGFKAWWVCAEGHDFIAAVRDASHGHLCPYCSGNKVWEGFNDLATLRPDLAEEWHPTKNQPLRPTQVTRGSKTKVWWVGKCSHEFYQSVGSRSVLGNNCPYCAGQKILPGFNDIATTHPEVTKEWHPTKNGELLPTQISAGTNKKVWWIGQCGHEFQTAISEKVRSERSNCPYCAGKAILAGFNDLKSQFPEVSAEWHPTLNGSLLPDAISAKSTKKVWWLCPVGHDFEAVVRARTGQGITCHYCTGQKILAGHNDLATTHPEIVKAWDYSLNGTLTPDQFSRTSDTIVWWVCTATRTHSYQMRINGRTDTRRLDGTATGCNICSNHVLAPGINDLATRYPKLAKQWHPTLNGGLLPSQIMRSYKDNIWWLCTKGHEWAVSPTSRLGAISRSVILGCPLCSSKTFSSKAENEIADILRALGENVVQHNRAILKGMELDIYLPERNLAIEYNGLYWHTIENNGKHKNSHYDKWKACQNIGIQLIQIWEDDWKDRREVILRSLIHKLGLTKDASIKFPEIGIIAKEAVYARKTQVALFSKKEAESFLKENHIQGFASGSHYVGLVNASGEICTLMVLKKEKNNSLNIIRYATDRSVQGGFTKLLKYATKTWEPDRFITFSDNCISDGGLYSNNGFIADKFLAPDYMYLAGNVRKHKFGYRLKKFQNDPSLKWEPGLTEYQLARMNSLYRIYDAGKIRWVFTPDLPKSDSVYNGPDTKTK
jgi:hypothetical protein